jgi:hypothetical protein
VRLEIEIGDTADPLLAANHAALKQRLGLGDLDKARLGGAASKVADPISSELLRHRVVCFYALNKRFGEYQQT